MHIETGDIEQNISLFFDFTQILLDQYHIGYQNGFDDAMDENDIDESNSDAYEDDDDDDDDENGYQYH